jgi:hypothetical protein
MPRSKSRTQVEIDFSKYRPCRIVKKEFKLPHPSVRPPLPTPKEVSSCGICSELMYRKNRCHTCCQAWCLKCDQNIPACPFCRTLVQGRERLHKEQIRNNLLWYANANAEEFEPAEEFEG